MDLHGVVYGVPKGIRTPVAAVKGRCPRPTRRWGHSTGGAGRDRTDDLVNAIHALSQLSYGPRTARYFALRSAMGQALADARSLI